jgi:hypothetical protein
MQQSGKDYLALNFCFKFFFKVSQQNAGTRSSKATKMGDKVIKIEPEAIKIGQNEEVDDAEKQQQPPRKVTKNRGGRQMDYSFLKAVNSVKELDDLRFKVICKNNTRI